MSIVKVGGVDPGPKPGLVILHIEPGTLLPRGAPGRLLRVERGEHLMPLGVVGASDFVAVERYVRGPKSAKVRDTSAQQVTERMAQDVMDACSRLGKTYQALPAGSVKPWATDARLQEYLVESSSPGGSDWSTLHTETRGGGGHDRDAARHALNLAVKFGLLPHR